MMSVDTYINCCGQGLFIMMKSFSKSIRGSESVAEIFTVYDEYCTTYDKMMHEEGRYKGPSLLVEALTKKVPKNQRKKLRLLDVAAGTGMTGMGLAQNGFTNIDALEPSEGMLDCLRSKKIYTNTFQEYVGQENSNVPQDCYDVVFVVGGMGNNHIPFTGVHEFVKLAKSGGLVMICMRTDQPHYLNQLKNYMKTMEDKQLWKMESCTSLPDYFHYIVRLEGVLFVYKVL